MCVANFIPSMGEYGTGLEKTTRICTKNNAMKTVIKMNYDTETYLFYTSISQRCHKKTYKFRTFSVEVGSFSCRCFLDPMSNAFFNMRNA